MQGSFALPWCLYELPIPEIPVDMILIQGSIHTLLLAKRKQRHLKVIVLVQENKNYLRTRKSKLRKKRRTEVLEEDTVIEDFTLIKYQLNHNKFVCVLNGSFWIPMFKQSEIIL